MCESNGHDPDRDATPRHENKGDRTDWNIWLQGPQRRPIGNGHPQRKDRS